MYERTTLVLPIVGLDIGVISSGNSAVLVEKAEEFICSIARGLLPW